MGLIGKHNIKDTSTSLIDYYLSHGYDDHRMWTGIKSEKRLSIPVSKFSGNAPKYKKELRIGDTLFYKINIGLYCIKIVNIRYFEPNIENLSWCIDFVFDDKFKRNYIFSSNPKDLYISRP